LCLDKSITERDLVSDGAQSQSELIDEPRTQVEVQVVLVTTTELVNYNYKTPETVQSTPVNRQYTEYRLTEYSLSQY